MQALTSSFPSSTRDRDRAQLDNIIFYSGPTSAMACRTTPADSDEWTDIDMIFAEVTPYEQEASIEHLDLTGGMETVGEDTCNAFDTTVAAVTSASSANMRLEGVSGSLFSPLDHSRSGFADRGGCAKSPEPQDVRDQRPDSVTAGASCMAQLEIQHNSGDIGTAVHNCPMDDSVSSALREAFCGEVSTFAPPPDDLAGQYPTLEMDQPHQPLNTATMRPGSPDTYAALSDKFSIEEADRMRRPQRIDDVERGNVSPSGEPLGTVAQENTSGSIDVTPADTAPLGEPTCNGVRSSQSADFTDAADLADIE